MLAVSFGFLVAAASVKPRNYEKWIAHFDDRLENGASAAISDALDGDGDLRDVKRALQREKASAGSGAVGGTSFAQLATLGDPVKTGALEGLESSHLPFVCSTDGCRQPPQPTPRRWVVFWAIIVLYRVMSERLTRA